MPTSSPSPDFWGGFRTGDDRYATAIIALKIDTGEVAWSFQTVHHNVWDYDLPAQPTLGTVTYNGRTEPALLQPTKQGLLFTLNRETGAPLIPVEERKVPQGAAPGDMGGTGPLVFIIVMFAIFYFLLIRPQAKRQKELKQMIEALNKGDEVVTTGGLVGRITEMSDQYITLQIANVGNQPVAVSVQRSSIATLLPKGTMKSI